MDRAIIPMLLDGRAIGDMTHILAALEERCPEPPPYPGVTPPRGSARSRWKTISTSSSARPCGQPSHLSSKHCPLASRFRRCLTIDVYTCSVHAK